MHNQLVGHAIGCVFRSLGAAYNTDKQACYYYFEGAHNYRSLGSDGQPGTELQPTVRTPASSRALTANRVYAIGPSFTGGGLLTTAKGPEIVRAHTSAHLCEYPQ